MQKARRHPSTRIIGLRPLVGTWFQVLSSPRRGSFHLSVTLLSSLSVIREYLALRDGPRMIQTGFHVTGPTQVPAREVCDFRLQDCHLLVG